MVEGQKFLVPCWKEIENLLNKIVEQIRPEYRPEAISGISQGELIPAVLISDLLVPSLGSIGVTFYKDINKKLTSLKITQPLAPATAINTSKKLLESDTSSHKAIGYPASSGLSAGLAESRLSTNCGENKY